MRLVIEDSRNDVGGFTSEYVVERITKWAEEHAHETRGKLFALGLSGHGKVMSSLLDALVQAHKAGAFSFQKVAVFATDEFVCEDRLHPMTQHSYLWHKLFKHIDVKRENVHVLDGAAQDLAAECEAYEKAIQGAGGLELVVMESGASGEVGRNAPGSSLASRTRKVVLSYDALHSVAEEQFDGDMSRVPRTALTIGVGTVMGAREVIVMFCGIARSHALESCVERPISHMWPISAVQGHPCCMLVCDEAATMELRVATVKYFEGLQKTAALKRLESASHLTHMPSRRRLLGLPPLSAP